RRIQEQQEAAKRKEEEERTKSKDNLGQLATAMHEYHRANQKFPKATNTNLSWRVALLPYIGQDALYRQFKLDEPWDGPNNIKLLGKMPDVYKPVRTNPGAGKTYYQVLTGNLGPFGEGREPRMTDFKDGLMNTLLIAEGNTAVEWTKPQDIVYNGKHPW